MYTLTFLLLAFTVAIIGTIISITHIALKFGVLKRRVKSLESKLGLLFILADDLAEENDEHIQEDYGFYFDTKKLTYKMYDEERDERRKK